MRSGSVLSGRAFCLSSRTTVQFGKNASDDLSQLVREQWGYGIADLSILFRTVASEKVIVRKGLDSGCLPDCQASTLCWVIVNVIVAILCNMRNDGRRGGICALHSEAVLEWDGFSCLPFLRHVAVLR